MSALGACLARVTRAALVTFLARVCPAVLGARFAFGTRRALVPVRLCLLGRLGLGRRLLGGQLGGVHDGELAGDNARAQLALGVRLHREHGYRGALVVVDGGGVVHRVDDGAVGCHDVEVGHCDGALVVEVEVALAVLAGNTHDGACAQVVGGSGGAPVDNDDAKTRVGAVGVGGADGDGAGLDRSERAVGSGRDDGGVRAVPDEAARLHGNLGAGEVVGIARRAEPQGALHGGLKAGLNDVAALHLEFFGQSDVRDACGGDIDRVGCLA